MKTKKKKEEKDAWEEEEELRLKMIMIRSQYTYHKFLYYEKTRPILSDFDFDKLEKEFEKISDYIERVYPKMYEIYQPKPWAGVYKTPYGYPKAKENDKS